MFELTSDAYIILGVFWKFLTDILAFTVPGTTMSMLDLLISLWGVLITGRIVISISTGGYGGRDNGSE